MKYTRCVTDDLRMSEKLTGGVEINRLIKKLTGKQVKDQQDFGLVIRLQRIYNS